MTQINWKLSFFFMALLVDCCRADLSQSGENVCLKTKIRNQSVYHRGCLSFEERRNVWCSHQETILVEEDVTEVYTDTEWCFSVSKFFKCSVKKNRVKKVMMPRVVHRTKIVPECCDGYEEDPKTNSSCIPVCSVECIHGECISPEMCACDSGFYGVDCQTPCPRGRWGRNCSEECDCLNDAVCGRVNGFCSCRPGWQGYRCEHPCPEGYHGLLCLQRCDCRGQSCDHITGNCLATTTEMTVLSTTEIAPPEKETRGTSRVAFVEADHHVKTEQEVTTIEIISAGKVIPVTKSQPTGVESKFKTTETIKSYTFKPELEPTKKNSTAGEKIFKKKIYSDVESKSKPSDVLFTTPEEEAEIIHEYTTSPISSTSEGTQRPSKYLTDNLAINQTDSDGDDEISSYADFTLFRFIPSLTLLTGVSILIFIIAARWMIINYRIKGKGIGKHKEEVVFNVERPKSFQRDCVFMDNYATENTIYLSDLEFNKAAAPILQTFKPPTKDMVNT